MFALPRMWIGNLELIFLHQRPCCPALLESLRRPHNPEPGLPVYDVATGTSEKLLTKRNNSTHLTMDNLS